MAAPPRAARGGVMEEIEKRRAAAATLAAWRTDEASDADLCAHVMFILEWLNPYPETKPTDGKGIG